MATKRYIYIGPVLKFGKEIEHRWWGEVEAESVKKARHTFMFDYKRKHGILQSIPIELPGELSLKTNSFDR